ncbi:methyltransferase type 11 [Deltaproteobacteria bacterium]|nr:methyltransferase type 11 [Deltaproteobacteria bacterium]
MSQNKNRFMQASGRLALKARADLLQNSLAVWPRRGKSLLEINCGAGFFLPMFRDCGFDVTGTELAPELRALALENVSFKADVAAAADDHLPFEDDAFDWVILHVAVPNTAGLAASVREALRVAAGGLAVTFWNAASLPYVAYTLCGCKDFLPAPSHIWWRVWRLLKNLDVGRLTSLSALAGPVCTWDKQGTSAVCHACLRVLPLLGAWCLIRMDIAPAGFVTPLPLRLEKARLVQADAM